MSVARKPLEPGEHGQVTVTPVRKLDGGKYVALDNPRARSSHYRATVYYRAHDGSRVQVQRVASTRARAEADALEGVRERLEGTKDARLTKGTPIVEACAMWLDENSGEVGRFAASTAKVYRNAYTRAIASPSSGIVGLTLAQANDGQRLRAYLSKVASEHGSGTAKHVRAILSGTFKLAVSYRVLATNELRQVDGVRMAAPKRGAERDRTRALTNDEREHLLDVIEQWPSTGAPHAVKRRADAADLAAFMLGTGARIGEALAVKWEHLTMTTGRCEIRGTKTASSDRVVTVPTWLLDRLVRRADEHGMTGYIFPGLHDDTRPWEKTSAGKAIRRILDKAGLEWATSHTLRRSVATRLHASGVPVNRVSDQLGHKDASMTARVYLGRDLLGDKADLAEVL